jgi:ATP-binding cassette subfamily F protein 3
VNIEHGKARAYRGNYSSFEEQRATELSQQAALFARQQREIRHMESFVERFRAKASKARQAQSRLKALERMQRIAPAHVDSQFEFSFARPDKLPRPLLALERQSAGYEGRAVIENLKLTIAPGDRVALLGRNGAGKSTVMKLLAGSLTALSGTRTEARDLRIGYFAQHQLEQLKVGESPVEHLSDCSFGLGRRAPEADLRDFLAGFGFRGDRVFEPVGPFSGGEKARLVLALLAYQRPNLLLLDEPTNHLDLEMRQALAVALQEYEGAVVLVSHDRYLLRVVADELRLVHAGAVEPFDGDLEDYARWLSTSAAAQATAPATEAASGTGAGPAAAVRGTPEARKQRKRVEAERRAALGPLKAALARQERELERLVATRSQIERELALPPEGPDTDRKRLMQLSEQQAKLSRVIQGLESAWMEAAARLEALAASQQDVD